MSHRTKHLPPANSFIQFVRRLRYDEASRQLLAIALIIVFTIFGQPTEAILFWVGVGLLSLGTLIRLWASGYVKKNKQLATDGPYAFVRHPLYVGNILMLFGFALSGQLWWMLPLTLALLFFYYPAAIDYEDRKLHRLFGEQWQQWSQHTKALIPGWSEQSRLFIDWSFRQSLIGNGEPVIVLFAIYCTYVLFGRLV